jgi:preprotein translocase subunit SecA
LGEEFHFDARKHVLEYDNVMSKQRTYIYEMRRKILLGSTEEVDDILSETVIINNEFESVLKNKKEELGEEQFYGATRKLVLQVIDMLWMEHLEAMDYMRSSVNLRAYGQRDPLVEYKKEGTRMFKEMQESIKYHIIDLLPNIGAGAFAREAQKAWRKK